MGYFAQYCVLHGKKVNTSDRINTIEFGMVPMCSIGTRMKIKLSGKKSPLEDISSEKMHY